MKITFDDGKEITIGFEVLRKINNMGRLAMLQLQDKEGKLPPDERRALEVSKTLDIEFIKRAY